jgi:uncharacterized protein with PQ loop repeat
VWCGCALVISSGLSAAAAATTGTHIFIHITVTIWILCNPHTPNFHHHRAPKSPLRQLRPRSSSSSSSGTTKPRLLPLASVLSLPPTNDAAAAAAVITPPKAPRTPRLASLLRRRGGGSAAVAATPGKMDGLTLLSTAMGYVVIAGSMLFKVPQAVRIFRKKSAEGLSASMYILESAGIAMSLAFSMKNAFPFSTYGEAVFILLQNVAIMAGAFGACVCVGVCACMRVCNPSIHPSIHPSHDQVLSREGLFACLVGIGIMTVTRKGLMGRRFGEAHHRHYTTRHSTKHDGRHLSLQ